MHHILNNSELSEEKKYQRLLEYFNCQNKFDLQNHLSALAAAKDERFAYQYLTCNEIYLSWQFQNYLNHTAKGIAARASLYASGLVYNGELGYWLNPIALASEETPGIKKYKALLKNFMKDQQEDIEFKSSLKSAQSLVSDSIGLASNVEKAEFLKSMDACKTKAELSTLLNDFIATREGKDITINSKDTLLFESLDMANSWVDIIGISVSTIQDYISVQSNLEAYQVYEDFFTEISTAMDIPADLRIAAFQLKQEMEMGYLTPTLNLIKEAVAFASKTVLDDALDLAGMSSYLNLNGYLTAINLTAFVVNNLFVNVGEMVQNAACTEGYAYLAVHYKNKLVECKQNYLSDRNEKNAWEFCDTYMMLWSLRKAGEEQFLNMSRLQGGIGLLSQAISNACHFADKEATVNGTLKMLDTYKLSFQGIKGGIAEEYKYLQKVMVECPVSVTFFAPDNTLICTLTDGQEEIIENTYGKFECVYRPTTGDYVKIGYFYDTQKYRLELTGEGAGNVTVSYATTDTARETYTAKGFEDTEVTEESTITIITGEDSYQYQKDSKTEEVTLAVVDLTRISAIFDSDGGSTVETAYADSSNRISRPADPIKEGFTFAGWYLSDTLFDFNTKLTENITLKAKWTVKDAESKDPGSGSGTATDQKPPTSNTNTDLIQEKEFIFTDVAIISGHWKYESVRYVYNHDIMGKVGATSQFQPDNPLTRAMFATVLYRMAGEPATAFNSRFTDVEQGKWYSSAIIWASEKEIVSGYTDGRYGINDNITREQIAKMLYLYGDAQGYDVSGVAALGAFTDMSDVSGWATGYMQWAVDASMISGKPNGDGTYRLDPKGQATRAECAKMLKMFLEKYQ